MSAYIEIVNAIEVTWKELFERLHRTNPTRLFRFIHDEEEYFYLYESPADSDISFHTYAEMIDIIREKDYEFYETLSNIDINNSDDKFLYDILFLIRNFFETEEIFDRELLFESKTTLFHATSDEIVRDIEDEELKDTRVRQELQTIATELGLRNYRVRCFLKFKRL